MSAGLDYDLRVRVVAASKDANTTIKEVAARFSVSTSSVKRWRRLERETGSVAHRPLGGGNPRAVSSEDEVIISGIVERNSDLTIEEFTNEFMAVTRKRLHPSSMSRALARMGLTRKKKR